MVKSKRGNSNRTDAARLATDGHFFESQQEGAGVYGPSAFLNQVFTKVVPKSFAVSKPKETAPVQKSEMSGQDAEQLVADLLNNNPTMSSATFLNLLKSQGIKFSKEADSASALPGLVRGKESAISFRSVRFLEKENEPKATDIGITKPKDKYLGFTKFRAVMLQEGLGNFGDAYFYSADALNSAAPIFEGKKIYADHPSSLDEQVRPERSVRDVLGHFENVHVEKLDDGRTQLVGDVVILPDDSFKWARSLMSHAVEFHQKFPDKEFIGLSINASGDAEPVALSEALKTEYPESIKLKLNEAAEKGIETIKMVSKITEAVSCDLVTEAGAGGAVANYLESSGGTMEKEQQEGGPGSGRRPGGGKGPQKSDSKPKDSAAKKIYKNQIDSFKSPDGTTHYLTQDSWSYGFTPSGRGTVKSGKYNVYAHPNDGDDSDDSKSVTGLTKAQALAHFKKLKSKKENETLNKDGQMEKEEMKQADGVEQHDDAAQDVELIKSMLKKAFGGEEEPSIEECNAAKEAMQAYEEMGHDKEKSGELAMEFMKAAKHMAAKQAKKESEAEAEGELKGEGAPDDEEQSEEKPVEEAVKESAKLRDENIKLRGELAKYKESDKKRAVLAHIEKVCKESKKSNAFTTEFKSIVKDAKSVEEVDRAWKLFEAGSKAVAPNAGDLFDGITVASEKTLTVAEGETTSISFDDCKMY